MRPYRITGGPFWNLLGVIAWQSHPSGNRYVSLFARVGQEAVRVDLLPDEIEAVA